jgi:hypothetical protein
LGDDSGAGDTRRRATFNELILKPEEVATTQVVLKALADARLITTSEDSAEVAHEALIREWPTLHAWLEENREGLRLHRQLTEAAHKARRQPHPLPVLFMRTKLGGAHKDIFAHAGRQPSLKIAPIVTKTDLSVLLQQRQQRWRGIGWEHEYSLGP